MSKSTSFKSYCFDTPTHRRIALAGPLKCSVFIPMCSPFKTSKIHNSSSGRTSNTSSNSSSSNTAEAIHINDSERQQDETGTAL